MATERKKKITQSTSARAASGKETAARPSLSSEQARELQKKSTEARRRNTETRRAEEREAATFCRILRRILQSQFRDPKNGETTTYGEAVTLAIVRKALEGDVNAFRTIRDTLGETPVQRNEITSTQTVVCSPGMSLREARDFLRQLEEDC